MKQEEKKMKNKNEAPLFTGEALRDSSVAEVEKVAEAAVSIYEGVSDFLHRKKVAMENKRKGLSRELAKE